MSLQQRYLQLNLNLQINICLLIILALTILLIFFFSLSISIIRFKHLQENKKEYFLTIENNIIESNINLVNVYLFQYESIIKSLNSEILNYLNNETNLQIFSRKNKELFAQMNVPDKTYIFKNISELNNYPDYDETVSSDEKKIFIYCDDTEEKCSGITNLIKANSLSYLNQNLGARNFKIPYYGNKYLIDDYIVYLMKYNALFSLNNTKIKEMLNNYENMDNIKNEAISRMNREFKYYKRYFEEYKNGKIKMIEFMYSKIYNIFEEYNSLNDTDIENFIKNQSILFQNFSFREDKTFCFNNWNEKFSRIYVGNKLMTDYISWALFNISQKLDIISLPFNNDISGHLISKNMCYYFVLKQLYLLNLIKDDISFNRNLLDEIYKKINNSEIKDVNDCKWSKFINKELEVSNNINNDFFEYYDLTNVNQLYLSNLFKKDINSYIFLIKSTYPNYDILKLFHPYFFSFTQLNFYSFTIGKDLSRMISSAQEFIETVKYLMLIVLWFMWILIIFIFLFLIARILPQITEPILRLTEIINLNLNELKDENLFEYKLDEDINKFFSLCKNLINGEMINAEFNDEKNINNIVDNNSNNMIINNKMILELIENQKNMNNYDKNIFLLKQGILFEKKNTKKYLKKPTSPKNRSRIFNGPGGFDIIKLIKINGDENTTTDDKNLESLSIKNNNNNQDDLYSKVDEEDIEKNNLKLYNDLIKITDYVYYGIEKGKINKMRRNIDKSIVSKNSVKHSNNNTNTNTKANNNDFKIIRGFNNILYYWYTNEKNNKNIKKFTYIDA